MFQKLIEKFSKKKISITIHYRNLFTETERLLLVDIPRFITEKDSRMYALVDYFKDKHQHLVKTFTQHPDVKAMVIELIEEPELEIVIGFEEKIKIFMKCETYRVEREENNNIKIQILLSR